MRTLSEEEKYFLVCSMQKFGGGFVAALANALARADAGNFDRIFRAFPDYMQEYGPGSKFYEATERNTA